VHYFWSFHNFGETKKLYTGGIFGFVRNPITLGLVLIYGGFILALPSGVMILGFVIFLLNSSRRIKMEEHYLERSFGDQYLQYKKRVGKYWPKF
jgi:protein-S-isoprenylcysteine O-methyltransferase Ste14